MESTRRVWIEGGFAIAVGALAFLGTCAAGQLNQDAVRDQIESSESSLATELQAERTAHLESLEIANGALDLGLEELAIADAATDADFIRLAFDLYNNDFVDSDDEDLADVGRALREFAAALIEANTPSGVDSTVLIEALATTEDRLQILPSLDIAYLDPAAAFAAAISTGPAGLTGLDSSRPAECFTIERGGITTFSTCD